MKRLFGLLAGTVMVLALSACGTVGKNFNDEMVKEIKINQTTKTQILDWFGAPFKEGVENGRTMWTYQHDKYVLGEVQSKDLVVLFDDRGVVKAFRYTSNTGAK